MLSIEHCKKVLTRNGNQIKEEDLTKLRNLLYQIAQMDYKIFKNNNNEKESNNIHQSLN